MRQKFQIPKKMSNTLLLLSQTCDEDKLLTHSSAATSNGEKKFSELQDVLQDVVIAGAHSTSVVFHWAVLLLVLNKSEQDKVSSYKNE